MSDTQSNIKYDFTGKKVIITGATGGIGSAITKLFLAGNAKVFMVSTQQAKLDASKEEFSQYSEQIHGKVCNFEDSDQVAGLVKDATEQMGGLDILICNAGITLDSLLIRTKNEDFSKVMQINLTANFVLNREAVRVMMKQKYGRIVNVSSVVGLVGNFGQCSYAAAKAGLIGFTKTVAMEFAKKGITANVVAPGFTGTAMVEAIPKELMDKMLNEIPLGRQANTTEVANAICFLASAEASYITGTVLNVSGGMVRS